MLLPGGYMPGIQVRPSDPAAGGDIRHFNNSAVFVMPCRPVLNAFLPRYTRPGSDFTLTATGLARQFAGRHRCDSCELAVLLPFVPRIQTTAAAGLACTGCGIHRVSHQSGITTAAPTGGIR